MQMRPSITNNNNINSAVETHGLSNEEACQLCDIAVLTFYDRVQEI